MTEFDLFGPVETFPYLLFAWHNDTQMGGFADYRGEFLTEENAIAVGINFDKWHIVHKGKIVSWS